MKTALLASIFALTSLLGGCAMTRRITSIQEHPTQAVLMLETADNHSILGYRVRAEHVFWQCVERQGVLACQRQCGAPGQDFSCPTAMATSGGGTQTNVR
ncbi:MAG: hypothetical protein Q8Q09_21960 [Deltaproteobacteria bacterium]|nr:hypothetical protein [Deltaproteobacteria bacterium]